MRGASVIRSSFKLHQSCIFNNSFRQTIKPETARQRLYSTSWSTGLDKLNVAEFLQKEIDKEQESIQTIPSKIDDFEVKLDGSKLTTMKSLPNETVMVSFNINHSLDFDGPLWCDSENMNETNSFDGGISKPIFNVHIKREDTTLVFMCYHYGPDFNGMSEQEDGEREILCIDKIAFYKGKREETKYEMSRNMLDGNLYNSLLKFLNEKGITNEFLEQM